MGKTALALQWARLAREHFQDGELYVDLRGFDPGQSPLDAAEALRMFLSALGVAEGQVPTSTQERSALYRRLVSGRRLLMILDNACTSEQVRPLLPGTSSCVALITSCHRLSSLAVRDGAQRLTLDVLTAAEARRLLTRAIGSPRAAAEPRAVAALAELCGHHPLALLIVAERIRKCPRLPLILRTVLSSVRVSVPSRAYSALLGSGARCSAAKAGRPGRGAGTPEQGRGNSETGSFESRRRGGGRGGSAGSGDRGLGAVAWIRVRVRDCGRSADTSVSP